MTTDNFQFIYDFFIESSIKGYIDYIKHCIENGHNINYQDSYGSTALHYASANAYIDIVELLLKNGADINIRNYSGDTPLMYKLSDESCPCKPCRNATIILIKASMTDIDISVLKNYMKALKKFKTKLKGSLLYPFLHRKFNGINENIIKEMSFYVFNLRTNTKK
jgi:hypothetical protein